MADFASKIPINMPLSARKKHKYQLFSSSVSCARLRRVQSQLKADGLDGILCILGIDSRYNSGSRQLLNYLLFGYCNVSADSISIRLSDELLEDVIVFVKVASVHVYCNTVNYDHLLPYIAHWRNLRLHCLMKDEDDEEKAEEFKILNFISMVKGCDKIGIPYGLDSTQKPFDPFVVEKWPLIQAFALEGFGGGGFFTMVHELTDVTSSLGSVYGMLDPVTIERLVTERLPLFERHCKSVLSNVDVESNTWDSLSKITESVVGEPLISYYKHGHMSDNPAANHSEIAEKPYCLFGVNTRKECLDRAKDGVLSTKNSSVSTTGINGSPANHMVCYAKDPKGTLSCFRTYFFGNTFLPLSVDGSLSDTNKSPFQSKDLKMLVELYLVAIDALLDGVSSFVQSQDIQQAYSAVDKCIRAKLKENNLSLNFKNVKFSIEGHDYLGRKVSLETNKHCQCLKMAKLFFYDIPSVERQGAVLGSIAFGETFLDSAVKVLDAGSEGHKWNTDYVIITENVCRFTSWQGENPERKITNQLEDITKSNKESPLLGTPLVHGEVPVFVRQSMYTTSDEGTLCIYEKGLIFIHQRYGPVSIPLSTLSAMHFYDKESSSLPTLLILTYMPSLVDHLPCHLVNDSHRVVVMISPRTKIFRQFYSDVLHLWKAEGSQPQLQIISELPEDLMTIHSYSMESAKSSLLNEQKPSIMSLSQMKSFIPHTTMSNVNNIPMHSKDIDVALGKPTTDQEQNNNLELLVTIITGVPGSYKEQLCIALMSLAKDHSKWIVLKRPLNHAQSFDARVLQSSLTNTMASQKKLLGRISGRKQVRVLLVTPGFTDIVDIIQAIYSHPKPEVKNHVKIGAVSCCVNPENMFMEEKFTLPKLLDQCAQGCVNNVVFTSCLDPQNEQLAMVQKLVRACNPEAAFILAKSGEVTRSSDVELIMSDSAFTQNSAVQKRHLMCPGWSLGVFNAGPCEPEVTEMCINIFGPLDKTLFVARLKALQGPIHLKDCISTCTIYSVRGHIHFADHNTITEVQWIRLKGSLTMNAVDMSVMPRPPPKPTHNGSIQDDVSQYFVVFTGFSLEENALKDWIRSCCRPKPQKKPLRSLKDLTKKELDAINAKHKCDPLPEGWFYNGTSYVNLTGEKSNRHPLLDNFIKEYLSDVNEEITKYNASITTVPDVDIFHRQ